MLKIVPIIEMFIFEKYYVLKYSFFNKFNLKNNLKNKFVKNIKSFLKKKQISKKKREKS
jgi:phosphotransferase system  glucose/maltose/N-acetylglucosamine-specific IIC component